MKILLGISSSLVLSLALFLITPNIITAFAQTSSGCALIEVGTPPDNEQLPAQCVTGSGEGTSGPCGAVVDWAQQINDNLNPTDSLNKEIVSDCGKSTPRSTWVAQTYWCAYNVTDSYNLAGIPGLSGASVIGLHKQMTSNPAFEFIDYRTDKQGTLQKVKPGYAFFIEGNFGNHISGQQHTGIIKTIEIDGRGNGTIVTLESNGGKKSKTWPIANWIVQHGDKRPLVAFGGSL